MSSRHILGIGLPVTLPKIVQGRLLSRQNFSEFDLIIWDPLSLMGELDEAAANRNGGMRIETAVTERSWDLIHYCQTGKDVIVILRDLPLNPIPLLQFQQALGVTTRGRQGTRVEWIGPQSFPVEDPALIGELSYSAVCQSMPADFRPLYRVAGANDIVGGFINLTQFGSVVIFAPHTRHWDSVAGKSPYQHQAAAYISALAELPALVRELLVERRDQPAWAGSFALPKEQEMLSEIDKLETHIGSLREQVQSQQQVVSAEREWKYLFTAYDEPLVSAVLRALAELGIKAVPGPKNHADIVAAWDGRLVAMEVKGKTGPAARQNAQQCITWVSELTSAQLSDDDQRAKDTVVRAYAQCIEQVGLPHQLMAPDDDPIPVKGILVINPFRELALDQRTEPAFPHAMLRTINDGRICALTSLQLLGMVLRVREKPTDAERLTKLLFEQVGVVAEFGDWRTFLSHRSGG